MSNLHQTMTRPINQDEFNQWVKELKVSSCYVEDDIQQMVLRDEDRRLQSEYYFENKTVKKNNKEGIIKKILKRLI